MSRPYHFLRLVSLYPLTQILQSQQANLFITWFLELAHSLLYHCSHIIAWKDLLILLGKRMPLPSFKTHLFQKVLIDYLHPAVTHFPSSSLKYWLLLIYLYLFCHFNLSHIHIFLRCTTSKSLTSYSVTVRTEPCTEYISIVIDPTNQLTKR